MCGVLQRLTCGRRGSVGPPAVRPLMKPELRGNNERVTITLHELIPSQQAQMGPISAIWATFGAYGHVWAWASSGLICGLHMGPIWAAHVFFIFLLDDIRYAWEPLKPWNCCNFLKKK